MVAGSFVFFASLAPDAFTNGDDAVYAQQIRSFDFSQRTTHLGYYLIASPLALFAPDFSDYSLNLMNALFGALTAGTIFLLTLAFSDSLSAANCAALFLVTNYVFVYNCVFAEIYISQTFFLVLALLFWSYGRAIAGGLAFGLSALITPSTLLAAPGFTVLRPRLAVRGESQPQARARDFSSDQGAEPQSYWSISRILQRRAGGEDPLSAWPDFWHGLLGPLIKFGGAAALVLVLCLSWVLEDYLFGDRGLVGAAGGGIDLGRIVMKEGMEIVVGVFAWLPLLLLGVFELARRASLRRFGLALLGVWLVIFLLGEKFGDVPAQLPTYALLGVAVGLGLERLKRWLEGTKTRRRRLQGMALLAGVAVAPIAAAAAARPVSGTLQKMPGFLPPVLAGIVIAAVLAGMVRISENRFAGWLVAAAMALAGGTVTVQLIRAHSAEMVAYREAVLEIGRQAVPDHLVVGSWTRGVLFSHYLHARPYHESWLDVRWLESSSGEASAAAARERWQAALAAGHEIWFLGDYPEMLAEARRRSYRVEPLGGIFHARRRPHHPIGPAS